MREASKRVSKKRTKGLAELEEKYFGKKGTPRREDYESQVNVEIIGELLKQIREKSHLTQSELAKKLGMDKAYVSKMENNLKTQRLDTFLKVLKALKGHLLIRLPNDGDTKEVELV
jgi:DNA-binding XRE family transcriptional regulator